MTDVYATDVLVVGAGPIVLTAALELWEAAGVCRAVLAAALPIRGQIVYRNGEQVAAMDLALPPDMAYGFAALPQYETERLLREALARHGCGPERGVER